MITRAQAEALLTLAESLEACERLGVELGGYSANGSAVVDVDVSPGGFESVLKGRDIRTFVRIRLPKTADEEYSYTTGPKGVTGHCRLVKPK